MEEKMECRSDAEIHSQIGLLSAEMVRRVTSCKWMLDTYRDDCRKSEEELKQLAENHQGLLQEVQRLKVALLDTNKLAKERGEMADYWQKKYNELVCSLRKAKEVTGVAAE